MSVKEYREHLENYLSIMVVVNNMRRRNIINRKEYTIIDTMFSEKYKIPPNSVMRLDYINEFSKKRRRRKVS